MAWSPRLSGNIRFRSLNQINSYCVISSARPVASLARGLSPQSGHLWGVMFWDVGKPTLSLFRHIGFFLCHNASIRHPVERTFLQDEALLSTAVPETYACIGGTASELSHGA
jgi:hypothetical protein